MRRALEQRGKPTSAGTHAMARGRAWPELVSDGALTRRLGKWTHALMSAYGPRHVMHTIGDTCAASDAWTPSALSVEAPRVACSHNILPAGREAHLHTIEHVRCVFAGQQACPSSIRHAVCSRGAHGYMKPLPTSSASHTEQGVRSDRYQGHVRSSRRRA